MLLLLFLNRESDFSKILTQNPTVSTIATFNIPFTRLRNCMFIWVRSRTYFVIARL